MLITNTIFSNFLHKYLLSIEKSETAKRLCIRREATETEGLVIYNYSHEIPFITTLIASLYLLISNVNYLNFPFEVPELAISIALRHVSMVVTFNLELNYSINFLKGLMLMTFDQTLTCCNVAFKSNNKQ